MSFDEKEIEKLAEQIKSCKKIMTALGDENRQHLILEMMKMRQYDGVQVGTIAKQSHLSRPAVSHHLQILKNVGILDMRREGTKNYYFFDRNLKAVNQLIVVLNHAKEIMEEISDQTKQERCRQETDGVV